MLKVDNIVPLWRVVIPNTPQRSLTKIPNDFLIKMKFIVQK